MNGDSILKALETFKQGSNMLTLNVGGSKANDQSRGSVEEGVQGGGHGNNVGAGDERLHTSCGTGCGQQVQLQDA